MFQEYSGGDASKCDEHIQDGQQRDFCCAGRTCIFCHFSAAQLLKVDRAHSIAVKLRGGPFLFSLYK